MTENRLMHMLKNVNWNRLPETANELLKLGKQNLPTIMTILGVGAFWGSGIMAAKGYHEAVEEIRDLEAEGEELDRLDKLKVHAQHETAAVGLAAGGSFLVFKANSINVGKIAGMTALYKSVKTELTAIQERADNSENEELKRSDLKKARQQIHRDYYEKNPVLEDQDVYETRNGNTLFIDKYSGVRFHSSVTAVNTAITELNTRLQSDNYCGLDEFYEMLDINLRNRQCGKYAAFRASSQRDVIHPNQILDWQDYVDPLTGEPRICFIDFTRFLTPSDEFAEYGAW